MLSSVLTSERAVEVNIAIRRTFVKWRQLLATHEELAQQLEELRWQQEERVQYVFETIQQLIQTPSVPSKRRIGLPLSQAQPGEAE